MELSLLRAANAFALHLMKDGRHEQAVDLLRASFLQLQQNPSQLNFCQQSSITGPEVGCHLLTPPFEPLDATLIRIPKPGDQGTSGTHEILYPFAFFVPEEAGFLCAVVTVMYTWALAMHCLAIQRGSSALSIEACQTYQAALDLSFLLHNGEAVGLRRVVAALIHNMLAIQELFFQRDKVGFHRRLLLQMSHGDASFMLEEHDRDFYTLSLFFAEIRSNGHAPSA